jgi:hypothetical protein
VTKLFRGCRYEVSVYTPKKALWSRHSSLASAQRSYREAVNNRLGNHAQDTLVELSDVDGGAVTILGREKVRA